MRTGVNLASFTCSGGWTRFAKHDEAIDRFELSCNEPSYCADLEEQKKIQLQAGNNKGGSFSVSCGLIILCLYLNFRCNILTAGFMH